MARSNQSIIDEITRDVGSRLPKFRLGQQVSGFGHVGVVTAIYANLDAVIDSFLIPVDWYENLSPRPTTPKTSFWYAVLLKEEGAVLLGEDDIW